MKKLFTDALLQANAAYPDSEDSSSLKAIVELALSFNPSELADDQARLKLAVLKAETALLELEISGGQPTNEQLCQLYATLKELCTSQCLSLIQSSYALSEVHREPVKKPHETVH
ncbi:hypothetical protein [Vibrio sp. WXL210]|uniref:hypothetical protein n=1 Tax=Vibrio sp. WXL210 TaxID=3450709 RepID=UPI003EC66F73